MPRCETERPGLYRVGTVDVRCFLHEDGARHG
jgi:hypothetical protein